MIFNLGTIFFDSKVTFSCFYFYVNVILTSSIDAIYLKRDSVDVKVITYLDSSVIMSTLFTSTRYPKEITF